MATRPKSSATCQQCHGAARSGFRLCWRCHIDNERDLAYSAGYDEGLHRGRAEGELRTVERIARDRRTGALPTGAVWLDLQMWRRIQQACHPDRNPSAAAAAVATWLNRVRDRVTP